jgi:pimeloyl-ACP methyl ester carboxylesterase
VRWRSEGAERVRRASRTRDDPGRPGATLGVPALVGYGTATSAPHLKRGRWLVERLPAARLQEVRGAGHFAPRTHPEEFGAFTRATASMP